MTSPFCRQWRDTPSFGIFKTKTCNRAFSKRFPPRPPKRLTFTLKKTILIFHTRPPHFLFPLFQFKNTTVVASIPLLDDIAKVPALPDSPATMAPSSALTFPKAYLVKELQSLIAWVILNHINTLDPMSNVQLQELMYNLYHGISKDPTKISFAKQCINGYSVFKHLFVNRSGNTIARLTDSPASPDRLQLNPRLIPGFTEPIFVGTGPNAHIRYEHLEVASISQAKNGNKTLINSRTLYRAAMTVSANLKTMCPSVLEILNDKGEMPSGLNDDDFFASVTQKALVLKAKGKLELEENIHDKKNPSADLETLTQGVQAEKAEKKKNLKMKWTYKAIPVTNWFSIAMFTKNGIATVQVENLLPLLKTGDYCLEEKWKHSRSQHRQEMKASKARERGRKEHLPNGGVNTHDVLISSIVDILADDKENEMEKQDLERKAKSYKHLQQSLKRMEWRIDHSMQMNEDCSALLRDHDRKWQEAEQLRQDMEDMMSKRKGENRESEVAIIERARKVAKLVTNQSMATPKIVPPTATTTIDTSTKSVPSEIKPRRISDQHPIDDGPSAPPQEISTLH